MKVSIDWLKELVEIKDIKEVERLLPLRTIGLKDVTEEYIELDMKGYNRADLLSMRGVAREIAAITDSKVTFENAEKLETNLPETKIQVEDENLCSVYCIARIEGLTAKPSKPEWVKKLNDAGMRSVNNIADITNLIMLEFGQPMHSFNANKVKDETLVVRLAKHGEKLVTLDGKERSLNSEDLLIADTEKPLGIAGVMGGKDSEASDDTTTILLEAAIFNPTSIRKTVQRHDLYSEASKRFQHGLTKTNLQQALSAAIKMYEELGGKLTAITLNGNLEDKSRTINLSLEKVNSLIGIELSEEEIKESLEKLGFQIVGWEVTIPYWRLDINNQEDLIEEVARMYGYEKIPAKKLEGELPEKIDQKMPTFIYDLKKALAESGLTEVQTYSFFSTKVLGALGFNEENAKNAVKVSNPISSETTYMRTFIWPNLIEVIEKNIKQSFKDIAVFEIGKIYTPVEGELPKESYRLAIALVNDTDNPSQELNAIVSQIKDLGMQVEEGGMIEELKTLFHPNRFALIKKDKQTIGGLAEVHPRFLNNFGIERRVSILEIAIEPLISSQQQ